MSSKPPCPPPASSARSSAFVRPAPLTFSSITTWAKSTARSAPGASAAAERARSPTPSLMLLAKLALKSAPKRPWAKFSQRMAAPQASFSNPVKKSSPTSSPPASTRISRLKNSSNPASFPPIFSKASAATNFAAPPEKSISPSTRFPISNAFPARARIFAAPFPSLPAWNTWSAPTTTPNTAATRANLTSTWSLPASPIPASRLPANTCFPASCSTRPTNLPKATGTIRKKPSATTSSTPSPSTRPTSETSSSAARFSPPSISSANSASPRATFFKANFLSSNSSSSAPSPAGLTTARPSATFTCVGPLRTDISRDLQFENFDCEILSPDPRVFASTPDGKALFFYNDLAKTAASIGNFSAKDASKYSQFAVSLEATAAFFTQLSSITPPAIDKPTPEDLWNLLKTGRGVRSLGKTGIFDLLRWGPMAVADFVAEFFETELLRAVIAARGIFGTALGPWSAGSTAVLLLRAAADAHPVGSAAVPRGGLGSFSRALAESAKLAGAEIRTDAEVRHILVKDGAVTGIVLTGGEEIVVEAVVSGVDPKRTFFHLLDPSQLDPTFANRIKHFRANGTVAKVNLALAGLPAFSALAESEIYLKSLSGRIHIGPEIDYLERAFDAAKYGDFSKAPWLDVTIPTILDPSLAPDGKHVLSAYVQL